MASYPTTGAQFRLQELLVEHEPPMTQAELVRLSGVSSVTVNRMALNRTEGVSLRTLGRLAAVLGCEPGEIIVRKRKGRK